MKNNNNNKNVTLTLMVPKVMHVFRCLNTILQKWLPKSCNLKPYEQRRTIYLFSILLDLNFAPACFALLSQDKDLTLHLGGLNLW